MIRNSELDQNLRKLNQSGVQEFSQYILEGASDPIPTELLQDSKTSEDYMYLETPLPCDFSSRYTLGVFLNNLLENYDPLEINNDTELWSSFSLIWFDQLCKKDSSGKRTPGELYRYVLKESYRHFYRHLVRTPWQLVREHGEGARFLLIPPRDHSMPLSVSGEILEQIGGRQHVLSSKNLVKVANSIYFDNDKCRPKKGVAGSGPGSARRFGLVTRQLDLTFDPECMTVEELRILLPSEFDRWY